MATKKTQQRTARGLSSNLMLTQKEREALRKGAEADMKKHGFKTVDELIAYYDSLRGY